MAALIPDKLFFRIGEVARIASLRPSVLRYWESEFNLLNPRKSRTGQRLYTKKDVELIFEIKKLLYSDKLTIEGARRRLTKHLKSSDREAELDSSCLSVIFEIKKELLDIRNSL